MLGYYKINNIIFNYLILVIFGFFLSASASAFSPESSTVKNWCEAVKYLAEEGRERIYGKDFKKFKEVSIKKLVGILFDSEFKENKISKKEIKRRFRKVSAKFHPDFSYAEQNEETAKDIYYAIEELTQELLKRLEDDRLVLVVDGVRYLKIHDVKTEIAGHKDFKKPIIKFSRDILRSAIKKKNYDIAKEMIDHDDFDPNFQDSRGWTDLMFALYYGDFKSVERIISKDNLNPNIKNKTGWTAFRFALYKKQEDIALEIARHKNYDPNAARDSKGWTDLMYVLHHGYLKVAKEIIKKDNFDPNVKNRDGWTAFGFALDHGYNDIAMEIRQHRKFDSRKNSQHREKEKSGGFEKAYRMPGEITCKCVIDGRSFTFNVRSKEGCAYLCFKHTGRSGDGYIFDEI